MLLKNLNNICVDEKESSKYYLTWLVELYVHEINAHKHELPVQMESFCRFFW